MVDFGKVLKVPSPFGADDVEEITLGRAIYLAINSLGPNFQLSPPQVVSLGSFALKVRDGGEHAVDVDRELLTQIVAMLRPVSMAALAHQELGL